MKFVKNDVLIRNSSFRLYSLYCLDASDNVWYIQIGLPSSNSKGGLRQNWHGLGTSKLFQALLASGWSSLNSFRPTSTTMVGPTSSTWPQAITRAPLGAGSRQCSITHNGALSYVAISTETLTIVETLKTFFLGAFIRGPLSECPRSSWRDCTPGTEFSF